MNLWLVSPAWRRPAVTRLALAQRRHLCDELSLRGVTANCVVIAHDENLEIAEEFGFHAIEMANDYLGRKVNAGFDYADHHEADVIAFCGSDQWLHIDLFDHLGCEEIVTGYEIAGLDLERGRLRTARWGNRYGVPPWLIPCAALERCDGQPCPDTATKALEWEMSQRLGHDSPWRFHDPHPYTRVELKSALNMTSFRAMPSHGEVDDPWPVLAEFYPDEVVALGLRTHEELEAQNFGDFYVREYAA